MMDLIDDFHTLYYGERYNEIWAKTLYKGIPCLKCPLDLWIYQEIIHQYRPDVIIECGTYNGGSAAWFADTIRNLKLSTRIYTIDIVDSAVFTDPDVTYIIKDSTDPELIQYFKNTYLGRRVLVILDSLHTKEHVLQELKLYSQLIGPGGYIIVEDTNLNGHPVREDWGPGPYEAVQEFIANRYDFEIDQSKEKFLLTFNHNGYLRRKG